MPEHCGLRLYLAGPARRDVADIARYSTEQFGEAAALRYVALVGQALRDIQQNPDLPGAKARPDLFSPDVRFYHLSFSRRHGSDAVKAPRHFIVYRQRSDDVIEIARILHDSRDPARHLPWAFLRKA